MLTPLHLDPAAFRTQCPLPALPGVVRQVLEGIRSGEAGPKEIGALIERDPAFAAHVLRLVNSAYYGLPTPVSSIRFAIAYLGLSEIARIALTLSVIQALAPKGRMLREFWIHSFHAALVAKRLGREVRHLYEAADDLHSAALLHDIGRLIYERFFPEHHAELLRLAASRGVRVTDAERELGWTSHGELGALAVRHWQLPEAIARACLHHELEDLEAWSPERGEPLLLVIAAANCATNMAAEGPIEGLRARAGAALRRHFNWSEAAFLLVMADVYDLGLEAQRAVEALL